MLGDAGKRRAVSPSPPCLIGIPPGPSEAWTRVSVVTQGPLSEPTLEFSPRIDPVSRVSQGQLVQGLGTLWHYPGFGELDVLNLNHVGSVLKGQR